MDRGSRLGFVACRLGLALGMALGAAGKAGAFDGTPPSAPEASRWVAADALIYLEMPEPSRLIDRLTDGRLKAPLGAIPSVRKAMEGDGLRKLNAITGVLAGKLGTTREGALRTLTGGGAVFAVEADAGRKPRAFLVVTPTDPGLLRKAGDALLELARQDASTNGRPDPLKASEHRGLSVYQAGPVWYAIVRDRLVIADGAETARLLVDRALDGLTGSLADDGVGKARRAVAKADALVWGFARTDRLRELDPKRYGGANAEKGKPQPTWLFGGWIEAARKAPSVSASLTWTEGRLAAELSAPAAGGLRGGAYRGFFPPRGSGAPVVLSPPGTVASLSLYRDLSAVWEARADLFRPEDVQNLAKLDTFAGQFFGGRDFGTGVLGALANDWRLVIALQDVGGMNPVPDVKLPAFALVADLKPDDEDFAQRLKVAFQSFIGLANLGTAQTKAPPLELGSESFEGVTIATARFMPARAGDPADPKKAPVHLRHNFSPSAAQVGDHFILSSSVGLTRDLVKALRAPEGKPGEATLLAEADGAAIARLVDLNRTRLVLQNMLEKGHDKGQAEGEVGLLAALLRYFGHGRLSVLDGPDATRLGLEFSLGR